MCPLLIFLGGEVPLDTGKSFIFSNLTGAQGRNRTTDTVIFSHVLYQLSYLGAGSRSYHGEESVGLIKAQRDGVQNGGCPM
jgi:hypothetical protein